MQTTNLQTLEIHQFIDEAQYKRALTSGRIPPHALALTPTSNNGLATQEELAALRQEVAELQSTLSQALDTIIALQNFYIGGEEPSFYIYGSILCNYRPGMTWNEWIDSEYHRQAQGDAYNEQPWFIFNNGVYNIGGEALCATNSEGKTVIIKSTDLVGEYPNYYFQDPDYREEEEPEVEEGES